VNTCLPVGIKVNIKFSRNQFNWIFVFEKNYYLLSVNFYLKMSLLSVLGFGNEKIKQALRQGAVVIDIRTAADFDRGKVRGSINIPIDRININLKRVVQMNKPIVICSNSDSENDRVIDVLKANGVKEIYNGGNWTKLWRMMRSL
jgi:phage shock protein E